MSKVFLEIRGKKGIFPVATAKRYVGCSSTLTRFSKDAKFDCEFSGYFQGTTFPSRVAIPVSSSSFWGIFLNFSLFGIASVRAFREWPQTQIRRDSLLLNSSFTILNPWTRLAWVLLMSLNFNLPYHFGKKTRAPSCGLYLNDTICFIDRVISPNLVHENSASSLYSLRRL